MVEWKQKKMIWRMRRNEENDSLSYNLLIHVLVILFGLISNILLLIQGSLFCTIRIFYWQTIQLNYLNISWISCLMNTHKIKIHTIGLTDYPYLSSVLFIIDMNILLEIHLSNDIITDNHFCLSSSCHWEIYISTTTCIFRITLSNVKRTLD